ncbi:MAG: hypothetical protein AAF292_13100 [Pseudomonadota bacterium]
MTDELGNEVWNSEYAPLGGALPSIDFDDLSVRYPGQWAEVATENTPSFIRFHFCSPAEPLRGGSIRFESALDSAGSAP